MLAGLPGALDCATIEPVIPAKLVGEFTPVVMFGLRERIPSVGIDV